MHIGRRRIGAISLAVLVAVLVTGCSEGGSTTEASRATTSVSASASACAADLTACARRSSLGDLVPDGAIAPASGTPIRIGMMNQEASPAGSYTQLSQAARAAIDFVNDALGGLHGHPLELELCDNGFSAEQSVACAQQMVDERVPVVLGGIDIFGTGIDVLRQNDIPYAGGIPISAASATSSNSFQWSGGAWGATVAFAHHAAEHGARRAAIVYADFGPIAQAADLGREVLERRNVDTTLVPYPITATDIAAALPAATAADPDVLIVLGADSICRSALTAVRSSGTSAQAYYLGACATPAVTDSLGDNEADGAIFNVEGSISPDDPDTVLYGAAVDRFGRGLDPVGAGTVTFRSVMNVYRALRSLDDGPVDGGSVMAALAAQRAAPSFMGHPSTCDHQQLRGLPAMCSPQQILVEMRDGTLHQLGTWIDVGSVLSR
jgi:branched-chain amino acid transport system substrate-binding protein